MSETRKHSLVVKQTVSEDHTIEFNDSGDEEVRPEVSIIVNPTLTTEDHVITITNS